MRDPHDLSRAGEQHDCPDHGPYEARVQKVAVGGGEEVWLDDTCPVDGCPGDTMDGEPASTPES